jgi:predicted transcriptional regulator
MGEDIQQRLKQRYDAAVESFVAKAGSDPNVIAVVVCGSLTYDVLWDQSDIDLTLIIRDQQVQTGHFCVIEDGITLNVELCTRSGFKRYLENSLGGSFGQSYYSNAKLVYTTDESLREYFDEMREIGIGDIPVTAFHIAGSILFYRKKCMKWLKARKDPLYAQWYLLMAAESLAQLELCLHGLPFSRDGIQKALKSNPTLMNPVYRDAMSHHYDAGEIESALSVIDTFLDRNIEILQQPALDYLSDREIKTMTMLNRHFQASGDTLVYVLDYLAKKGIIEKASKTIRLTPKGKQCAEEIGYILIGSN